MWLDDNIVLTLGWMITLSCHWADDNIAAVFGVIILLDENRNAIIWLYDNRDVIIWMDDNLSPFRLELPSG